jgi:hypothetical protein
MFMDKGKLMREKGRGLGRREGAREKGRGSGRREGDQGEGKGERERDGEMGKLAEGRWSAGAQRPDCCA